ncbi:hypothetical protein ILYODFUR_011923 [Ilyodon furcidens]|uniref:Uncharacterized protein n=1 Tax=Ilyodon furcidens TaxID=33524 RepID=A0ABV0U6I5_9TELE
MTSSNILFDVVPSNFACAQHISDFIYSITLDLLEASMNLLSKAECKDTCVVSVQTHGRCSDSHVYSKGPQQYLPVPSSLITRHSSPSSFSNIPLLHERHIPD